MAGYTLYGWHQTGSLAIEAALNEAGVKYTLVPIDTKVKQQHSPEYTAINPRQQVPALVLPDGTVMTEGAAMLLHIADAFPAAKLAPPPGTSARAMHDRWLLFFAVNVYEGELRKVFPDRYVDDAAFASSVASAAFKYVERHYAIFEQQLQAGPYFMGQAFSVLDIYVWMLVQWMDIAWLERHCPKVLALTDAVMNRPMVNPVHLKHFGPGPGIKP